jgi:predicted transposase/invertase (TIGR01784 family)
MTDKDIVSKDILKRIAIDIARILLNLKVDGAEIIETEYQRVEDRRADLVVRMWNADGEFILHIEIQNANHTRMSWRMLRYRAEIGHVQPNSEVRQYVIYIGKAPLNMADHIQKIGLDYRYQIIDMRTVDCQTLLAQDDAESLILASLCDFKGRPEREVIHYILQRLRELAGDNESQFRENLLMLEILGANRGLENIIEEEEKMLSQVEQSRLPSFKIGYQKGESMGEKEGEIKGERKLLYRLITHRFGPISPAISHRLKDATLEQIERWADNILDAATLDDVFKN